MLNLIERMLRKRAQAATAEYRNHVRMVRSKAPPLRIELVSATDAAWLDSPGVQKDVQFLTESGFKSAGVFTVKGNDKVVMAGFAAPQHVAYASLAKNADHVFVSFLSHFADGSAFECCNMPVPFEPPCPGWLVRQRRLAASPPELWSQFRAARPAGEKTAVAVGRYAGDSAEDFFRYQAWMAERGGATRDELAARYKAIGKLPAGDEGEKFLTMARSNEIEGALCNWWRLQPDAPCALDEVLESLIVIHDEMSPDLLINAYWCATDDIKAKETEFGSSEPREAFAQVVTRRGAQLHRVFQKRTPLMADFYLPRTRR